MPLLLALALAACMREPPKEAGVDTGLGTDPLPGELGSARVGYLYIKPSDLDDPEFPREGQIRRLTHVVLAYWRVEDGALVNDLDEAKLRALVQRVRDQANASGVKMLASIGGYYWGTPTSPHFCELVEVAEDPSARVAFAATAAATLDGFCDNAGAPCFDGVDVDVEFVGQSAGDDGACVDEGGTVAITPDFRRAEAFRDLVTALRPRFDVLTFAAPGDLFAMRYAWPVLSDIAGTVDLVNVMAYDYAGFWTQQYQTYDTTAPDCGADTKQCWTCDTNLPEAVTDHAAPLHASAGAPGYYNFLCDPGQALEDEAVCDPFGSAALDWESPAADAVCVNPYVLAADRAVAAYVHGLGVDPKKIVLGTTFFARAFRNVGTWGRVANEGRQPFGLRDFYGGMCVNDAGCWGDGDIPVGSCETPDGVVACDGGDQYNWLTDFAYDDDPQPDPRAATWDQVVRVCPEVADLDDLATLATGTGKGCATPGWTAHYDEVAEAAWLYHAADGLFVTFDSPRSMRAKARFVLDQGLGGMMMWHIGHDDPGDTLLETVHGELGLAVSRRRTLTCEG